VTVQHMTPVLNCSF